MVKERIKWIDTAKGIGIILVVLSHFSLSSDEYAIKFIFSFHMPLFFFLAGMVFNANAPFKQFFIKKAKGVYVPFFIFLCIEYLICFISRRNELMLKDFLVEFVFQTIGFDLANDAYLFNGPIWFLCALFFAEIVFYFVARKNKIYIYTISMVVSLICAYFIDFRLPFGIGYIFAISVFMSIGCIFKQLIKTDRFEMMQKNKVLLVFLFVFSFAVLFFTANLNDFVSMRSFSYGNYLLFVLNAILGIIMIVALSMLLQNNKILRFYGENSIIVLCLHLYMTDKFVPVVFDLLSIGDSILQNVYYRSIIQMVFLFIIMACFYPLVLLANKYFYFLFGKSKNIKLDVK